MGEMVERVASIIECAFYSVGAEDGSSRDWMKSEAQRAAREVVAAMREPTEAMIDKAEDLDDWGTSDDPGAGNASAKVHWQAMIDEALKP